MSETASNRGSINLNASHIVLARIINSTLLFILSYVVVRFYFLLVQSLFAWYYNKAPLLTYDEVIYTRRSEWYQKNVVLVYSAGPFGCFAAAIVLFGLFYIMRKDQSLFKLQLLWMSLVSFGFFIGYVIGAPLDQMSGMGYTFSWLYMDISVQLVIACVAILVLFALGMLMRKPFLMIAPSTRIVKSKNQRAKYLFQVALAPVILGSGLAYAFDFPENDKLNLIVLGCMIILVVSTFVFNLQAHNPAQVYKRPIEEKILWAPLAVLILLYFLFRFLLDAGIQFP